MAWHNFVSAAVGIAIAVAVVRGLVRTNVKTLGNFWVDLTRCSLYVLLPISIVVGLVLRLAGRSAELPRISRRHVARRLHANDHRRSDGLARSHQRARHQRRRIRQRELRVARTRTRLRSPTSSRCCLIFLLGAGLTYTYGKMVKDHAARLGDLRGDGDPVLRRVSPSRIGPKRPAIRSSITLGVAGGNMEGKECRFGVAASALFATVTTDTSCGAVNSMHDSFMPLGGLVPLVNMQLGEIVFGGVGSGLYGMIVFVVLTVFIAGLMVGRTPEYLGKKIERREVQFAILAVLVTPVLCLVPTAIAALVPAGLATLEQRRPARILGDPLRASRRPTRTTARAFAGLGANLFYNFVTGVEHDVRALRRSSIPALALAGALAGKKAVARKRRNVHDALADLRRAADRRHPDRRRADVFPGRRARTDRRTPAHAAREDVTDAVSQRRLERRPKARSLFDRAIVVARARRLVQETRSRAGRRATRSCSSSKSARLATSIFFVRDLVRHDGHTPVSILRSRPGCGSRCCSRTSPRRWPKGAARRKPTSLRRTKSDTTRGACGRRAVKSVASTALAQGRSVRRRGRTRSIPGDGDVIEGAATVDESAITGESAPVIREVGRRPQRRHRRHARALRPDRRARYGEPGRKLPRPDDLAWSKARSAKRRQTKSRSRSCSPG